MATHFLSTSTGATGRFLRSNLPGPGASQRIGIPQPQHDGITRHGARLQPCQAERPPYRRFSSSDWGGLFQSLADMSKAFEDAAAGYEGTAKSYRPERTPKDETEPIETDANDVEKRLWVPVDVEEHAEGYSLYMDVPGLQKSDVKVQIFPQQRMITISGERKRPTVSDDANASGRKYRRRYERKTGNFSRTLRLAKDLDEKTISARVDKGVLHITAKKIPAAVPADDSVEINIE